MDSEVFDHQEAVTSAIQQYQYFHLLRIEIALRICPGMCRPGYLITPDRSCGYQIKFSVMAAAPFLIPFTTVTLLTFPRLSAPTCTCPCTGLKAL
jgi:hypothetical protein